MPIVTSTDLRTRYQELLNIIITKTIAYETTDAEEDEIQRICTELLKRGYKQNSDASDWLLALSSSGWQLQDET